MVPVWIGATLGLFGATVLALVAGRALAERISERTLSRVGAVAFALVGVVTLGDPLVALSVYGPEGRIGASIIVAALAIAAELGLSAVQRAVTPEGIKLERGSEDRARTRFGLTKRRIQTAP